MRKNQNKNRKLIMLKLKKNKKLILKTVEVTKNWSKIFSSRKNRNKQKIGQQSRKNNPCSNSWRDYTNKKYKGKKNITPFKKPIFQENLFLKQFKNQKDIKDS